MKTKICADGCRAVSRKYHVSHLNDFGEVDAVEGFENKAVAISHARWLVLNGVAEGVVVELHIARRPACMFKKPDTFKTVLKIGSAGVLQAWDGGKEVRK